MPKSSAKNGRHSVDSKRFAGKLALVTGANRGIGFAIAGALAREGCDLVITGRESRSLIKAGRELGELGGLSSPRFARFAIQTRSTICLR